MNEAGIADRLPYQVIAHELSGSLVSLRLANVYDLSSVFIRTAFIEIIQND